MHVDLYRADGPAEFKVVGETEFVQGIAAMSASGRYGETRVAAGIVGTADLRLGDRVAPGAGDDLSTAGSPRDFDLFTLAPEGGDGIFLWTLWNASHPCKICASARASARVSNDRKCRAGVLTRVRSVSERVRISAKSKTKIQRTTDKRFTNEKLRSDPVHHSAPLTSATRASRSAAICSSRASRRLA